MPRVFTRRAGDGHREVSVPSSSGIGFELEQRFTLLLGRHYVSVPSSSGIGFEPNNKGMLAFCTRVSVPSSSGIGFERAVQLPAPLFRWRFSSLLIGNRFRTGVRWKRSGVGVCFSSLLIGNRFRTWPAPVATGHDRVSVPSSSGIGFEHIGGAATVVLAGRFSSLLIGNRFRTEMRHEG